MAPVLGASQGIAFIVSYTLVCDAIAKACSSPQTAEINIGSREGTLMKWVHIGQAEGLAIVLIAAAVDTQMRPAILAGGLLAMAVTEAEYLYAKRSGKNNPGPSTEQDYSEENEDASIQVYS